LTPYDHACRELADLSRDVGDWLLKQPSVGEESLTDWFLYQLSERVSWIHYRKFTRAEESRRTGADWEWWFLGTDGALGVRVQAKRLRDDALNYDRFAFPKRSGKQIRRLLRESKKRSMPALFALYYPAAPNAGMCGGLQRPQKAIFIADALKLHREIVRAKKKAATASQVVSFANPVECLVCCPLASPTGLVESIWRYLTHYFPEATSTVSSGDGMNGFQDAPLMGSEIVGTPRDAIDGIPNVDAILVFDLTQQERG
jgi:hypothetical protein